MKFKPNKKMIKWVVGFLIVAAAGWLGLSDDTAQELKEAGQSVVEETVK